MGAPHRISHSDNIVSGAAESADRTQRGVPLLSSQAQAVVVLDLGTPVVADPDGIAASQAVAGAGNLTINGALAVSGAVTFDVPRNISIDSDNAANTTQTATVTGKDAYGAALVEVLTFNGVTEVVGVKAFKSVSKIAISAAITGNAFAGSGSKLGLPYRPVIGGFISGILNENTADAGTYVAPSRVAATGTTVDVRGTYAPAGALDGTNRYKVRVAIQNGPADTDAFGVAQYSG